LDCLRFCSGGVEQLPNINGYAKWSADDRYVAIVQPVGNYDNLPDPITIVDLLEGDQVVVFSKQMTLGTLINRFVWNPKAATLIAPGAEDNQFVEYDAATGVIIRTLDTFSPFAIDWSPDGNQIVYSYSKERPDMSGSDIFYKSIDVQGLLVWEAQETSNYFAINEFRFSPDSTSIAVRVSTNRMGLLSAATGATYVSFDGLYFGGIEWLPDNLQVMTYFAAPRGGAVDMVLSRVDTQFGGSNFGFITDS
jgi:WD40 repeat protein